MSENTEKTAESPESKKPAPAKLPSLVQNYISFLGMAVIVASLSSIFLLILVEFSKGSDNPYTVLVTYILLPGVLMFGIALVILGVLLERRRRRKNPDAGLPQYPILDLNDASRRRSLVIISCLLFAFLFMTGRLAVTVHLNTRNRLNFAGNNVIR